MAKGHKNRIPAEERAGLSQTQYRVELAHKHLGVRAQDAVRFPFLRDALRRIARQLNQGRAKDAPLHPFDLLQASDREEARRLWSVYDKVPPTFRRFLCPEAVCQAARVDPSRVVGWITEVAVRQNLQVAALVAAVSHARVVSKAVAVALTDAGHADRQDLHKAVGFLPTPKSAQTIVNVNQQATAVAPIVPLSSPESSIAMLARAFAEARQTMPPPTVRNTVNVTARRDETYDNEDES